ncbi:reverse transcriptase domain-containing protein [Tanacetum coccineum]
MLQRCKDAHLVLNWEKCHFMVKEGIVLGHKVSGAGLEVDKAKINVISKLPPPTNIKEISDDSEVDDNFPGETLMEINTRDEPWFANYLVADIIPKGMTYQQKNKFFLDLKHYICFVIHSRQPPWETRILSALLEITPNLATRATRIPLSSPLRSEDPNEHLKDFLKLVDSLDLDGENRERMRLRLFQFSLCDQASNWLERLPAGSITIWEDLTTRFLAQLFPPGRTAKLQNDILMFSYHFRNAQSSNQRPRNRLPQQNNGKDNGKDMAVNHHQSLSHVMNPEATVLASTPFSAKLLKYLSEEVNVEKRSSLEDIPEVKHNKDHILIR